VGRPWLTQVTGASADAAARGLFVINLAMMFTFMAGAWRCRTWRAAGSTRSGS